jgi:hypothetical protein
LFSGLFRLPILYPVPMAAGLGACILALVMLSPRSVPLRGQAEVSLSALRGDAIAAIGSAPAFHALTLNLDATAIKPGAYRIELVSATGKTLWTGSGMASGNRILAETGLALDPGTYWIRILASQEGAAVREYGLRVRQ